MPIQTSTPLHMSADPSISVVVPLYNERDNVRPLVEAIRPVLDRFEEPAECILVDDGSTDGTLEELKSAA
ncbi:MAG: glycosyltransferase, partial [Anaerolineales bacterium]|nr:glycosyltransferase [Anaerolineales bacterium]